MARLGIALLTSGLLLTCGDAPHLQAVPINDPSDEASLFRGNWYDFEGLLSIAVDGPGSAPQLRLSPPANATLVRSTVQDRSLHVWFDADGKSEEIVFRFVEGKGDMLWVGRPGPDALPSGCGWEKLVRNPSIGFHLEKGVDRAVASCLEAGRVADDWLVDHF